MNVGGIEGVSVSGGQPGEPPMIVVAGPEKVGKSVLSTTLVDWPRPGDEPLVLAFDATGPDSCAQLGFRIKYIKVKDRPGLTTWQKTQAALANIEQAFRVKQVGFKFSSLVIDCASTMCEAFLNEEKLHGAKDGRHDYLVMLEQAREVLWRLMALRVPLVWYSWLEAGQIIEEPGAAPGAPKRRKTTLGGPMMPGRKFKPLLCGKAHYYMWLEKIYTGVGSAGADRQGFTRQIHTKIYNNIDADGRYVLPEPCFAHLGYILDQIQGTVRNAPAAPVEQLQVGS